MNYNDALVGLRKILTGPLELDKRHVDYLINKVDATCPEIVKVQYCHSDVFKLLCLIRDNDDYKYWEDFQFTVWYVERSGRNGNATWSLKDYLNKTYPTPEFMRTPVQRVEIYD